MGWRVLPLSVGSAKSLARCWLRSAATSILRGRSRRRTTFAPRGPTWSSWRQDAWAESWPTTHIQWSFSPIILPWSSIVSSHMGGVQKLLFLGSTCIYPKLAKQPMSEDQLLTGELEPTNQWYAVAKIAGIKLCEAYRRQYGSDF